MPAPRKRYTLSTSDAVLDQFRELYQVARQQGVGEAFPTSAATVFARLQNAPEELGEPCYSLPVLSLDVRLAVVGPLGVTFGINRKQRTVFVKEFKLLESNH